jgi:hypothetical protein
MFQLNNSSPWAHILCLDPAEKDTLFSYECHIDTPRVIVGKTPEDHTVQVQDFGDHCYVNPFVMENEKQLSDLAIEAIIKAHDLHRLESTVHTLSQAKQYLVEDIDCGYPAYILVSPQDKENVAFMMNLMRELGDQGEYLAMRKIIAFEQIPPGVCYVLPDAEFLGVIAERKVSDEERHYGIGIINTRAVVKVQFRTIDIVSSVLSDLMIGISALETDGRIANYNTDYWLTKLMMPRIKDAKEKLDAINA